MSKKKLISLIIIFVVLVAGSFFYLNFDLDETIYNLAKKELQKDTHDNLQRDGLEVLLAGTGSPRHSENRTQVCQGIIGAGQFLLFDTGQACVGKLLEMEAPVGQVSAIFLTHLHADHMSGLAEVISNSWIMGRRNKLRVYGPPGTRTVLDGFAMVYRADVADRVSRRGKDDLDPSLMVVEPRIVAIDDQEAHSVYEKDGLVVKAFQVDHPDWQYSYGYRIEYEGKVLVFSGDTRFSQQMIRHAANADILVHEAYSKRMLAAAARAADDLKIGLNSSSIRRIQETHSSTLEAARVAKESGAKKLVLNHIIPPLFNPVMEWIFMQGIDEIYDGEVLLAEDGMRLDLASKD